MAVLYHAIPFGGTLILTLAAGPFALGVKMLAFERLKDDHHEQL